MAYFSTINSALGIAPEEEGQQQTNIFAGQPGQGEPQTAGGTPGQQGAQPLMKASTEGQVGGGAGAGTNLGSSEAVPGAQAARTSQDVIRKNIGRTSSPKAISKAQADLTAAQGGVKNEADTYMAGAQSVSTAWNDQGIDAAVGSDPNKLGAKDANQAKLDELRSYMEANPNADYQDFDVKTDYEVEDINQLGTDAGVKNLLRRDGGEQYSAGEAAFDMQLLNRDKGFNTIRSQLRGGQDALAKQVDTYRYGDGAADKGLSRKAQELVDKEYETSRGAVASRLEGRSKAITDRLDKRVSEANAERAALRSGDNSKQIEQEASAAYQELVQDLLKNDPALYDALQQHSSNEELSMAQILQGTGVDPSQFYGVRDDISRNDIASGRQADQFNLIMSLLGRGGDPLMSQGKGNNRQAGGFDKAAYTKALRDAAYNRKLAREDKRAAQKTAESTRVATDRFGNPIVPEGEEGATYTPQAPGGGGGGEGDHRTYTEKTVDAIKDPEKNPSAKKANQVYRNMGGK